MNSDGSVDIDDIGPLIPFYNGLLMIRYIIILYFFTDFLAADVDLKILMIYR
ncbi:MAG: hypothetical protein CM1200mP10_09180 [Candidatus Neomarinimicrobiota bacterium]|nr:MAG: hypothetical protein CM1200mP10_09180 [Candidatus Neomarinimicrobiota bacterium]